MGYLGSNRGIGNWLSPVKNYSELIHWTDGRKAMSTLQQAMLYTDDFEDEIIDSGVPTSPQIVRVRPNDDFSLTIAFKTGEVKRFDVTPYLHASEFFHELADLAYFSKAFPDGSSVEWPNGQSFCSDTLYPNGIPADD